MARPEAPPEDESAAAPRRKQLLRRWAWGVGWALVFSSMLAVSVLIHANTRALRSALASVINSGLDGEYRGRVEVSDIERLGPWSAAAREIRVSSESGEPLLSLTGVHLQYQPLALLRAAFGGEGSAVSIDHVRVDESRVVIALDAATGEWSLVQALSKPPRVRPRPPGREPTVYSFSAIEIGKLDVIVEHPSFGKLEARIDRLQGSATAGGSDNSVMVERFGVRLTAPDGSSLDGTGSFRLLPKGYLAGAFHGFLDGTEVDVVGQWDEGILTVRLGVPLALPEQVRRRIPAWPLEVPLALELEARGPPDAVAIETRLRAQSSQVQAKGLARLVAPASATLSLQAMAIDSRAFWPTGPAVQLDARANAEVQFTPAGPTITVTGETDPTSIGAVAVPRMTFGLQAKGDHLGIQLRGADSRGQLEASLSHPGTGHATLSLQARQLDLSSFAELGVGGRLDASVQANVERGELSGQLDANVRGLRAGVVRIVRAQASGSFAGHADHAEEIRFDTQLSATGIGIDPIAFDSASAATHGTLERSRFEATFNQGNGRGKLQGVFDLLPEVAFDNLAATWSTPALALAARASHFTPARRELRGGVLELSGSAGRVRGSIELAAGRLRTEADADGLDLAALARTLGRGSERLMGRLSGHAELALGTGDEARGALDLQVRDLGIRDVAIGSVEVDARLEGRKLDAELATVSSPFGSASLSAHLDLASVLSAPAWRRATGQSTVKLSGLPLWPLGLLASRHSRVKDLDGRLEATLQVERSDPLALPNLFFQAGTSALEFDLASDDSGSDARIGHFERFAVHTSASVDGASGQGVATLLVTDEHGALVTTSGSLQLDLDALIQSPGTLIEQLVQTPLDALIRLHPRPLSLLPPPLTIRDFSGSVEATLMLRGSLADPTLALSARASQLLGSVSNDSTLVDVTASADWAPNTGRLTGQAEVAQAGVHLVAARLEGSVPNPLSTQDAFRASELRAAAMLNGVPLELWPSAARNEVTARIYGSVDLTLRAGQLEQGAQLEVGELSIAGHSIGNGRLTLQNRENQLHAELWLGSAQRELRAQLTGEPSNAEGGPLAFAGSLVARDFDAASLSPLIGDILSDVSGDVDADLKFRLHPGPTDTWYLGIDGEAALQHGTAQLDLFGLELRELEGRVRARSTPEYTVLQIDPVSAQARSRTPNFSGDAELWMQGLRVVSGETNLTLAEVPLSIKGATRGTARGQLRARLERKPEHMDLEVKIPELRVTLPTSSTRSLISLDPNPDVEVLQATPEVEERSATALVWKMAFNLGDRTRIRRADLDIPLTGEPHLEFQHTPRPSGTIEAAPGGRITIFNQSFSIDRGVLQFVPDEPDNPLIDFTASWRAADGTTVYVDITGRAKQASVLTRDDRGLEDVERFYLLTGNSPRSDGAGPTFSENAGEDSALGQTFALGVNQLLLDSLGNVQVSVGTTRDDRASYSASVRLSDKLTFQGSFKPAAETRLEESTNDLTGTLDYQFSRRWSLRTELGTSGGAFDILWSHRY